MLKTYKSKKKPPIEISDKESISTFSPPSPSSSLFRIGVKRGHPQSSPENENQNPIKKTIKPTPTTASTSLSLEQYLNEVLENLIEAYKGI
jgi:hypothetical protein